MAENTMVTFQETKTNYWDGITTRDWVDRSISPEEAGELLTKLSREKTLLYEALNKFRHGPYWNKDLDFHTRLAMVNYTVMFVFWPDSDGPGSASHYEKALTEKGFDMDRFFYDHVRGDGQFEDDDDEEDGNE